MFIYIFVNNLLLIAPNAILVLEEILEVAASSFTNPIKQGLLEKKRPGNLQCPCCQQEIVDPTGTKTRHFFFLYVCNGRNLLRIVYLYC